MQIGDTLEPFVDEIDLASFALSFHFTLDFLCHKEGTPDSAPSGTIFRGVWIWWYGTIATLVTLRY